MTRSGGTNMHSSSPRTVTGHLVHLSWHAHATPRTELPPSTVVYGHRQGNMRIKEKPSPATDSVPKTGHTGTEMVSVNTAMSDGSGVCVSKKRSLTQSARCMPTQSRGTTGRHLNTNPADRALLRIDDSSRWNSSNSSVQALRLEKEWNDLSVCRTMKKNSQTMYHRVDRKYVMSGAQIMLQPRYQIDDNELRALKEFSRARKTSQREARKTSSSRHYKKTGAKRDEDQKWEDTSQPVGDSSGLWASEGTKTPTHKTEDDARDRDCRSSIDNIAGEGKSEETVEKGDTEKKVTNYGSSDNDSAIVNHSHAKHGVGKEEGSNTHDDGQSKNKYSDSSRRKSSQSVPSSKVTVKETHHQATPFRAEM